MGKFTGLFRDPFINFKMRAYQHGMIAALIVGVTGGILVLNANSAMAATHSRWMSEVSSWMEASYNGLIPSAYAFDFASLTFNVQSPADGATVSGVAKFTGQAGSLWKNVAAYDPNQEYKGSSGKRVGDFCRFS